MSELSANQRLTPPAWLASWNAAWSAPWFVEVASVDVESPEQPKVMSAQIRGRKAKVVSYFFGDHGLALPTRRPSGEPRQPATGSVTPLVPAAAEAPGAENSPKERRKAKQHTRLKPPQDMVRLGDRLFFLLQPPLEYLLQDSTLEFPFEPFPYQFAGVSFLFARQSAVLADEMGLGKTMQAITAVRMLIRSGQAQRILLICPKPLVTNWLREFKLWAPEITTVPINGNPAQREWLWRRDQTPVKIANYELLVRDQEYFLGESNPPYDLVILDEAQRVKNQDNSTSKVIRQLIRERSWALTGTPIENSIEDLVGIFEFVSPGLVHSQMSVKQVRDEVKDFIIRRTKDIVMNDMPPKMIHDEHLELAPEQLVTYQEAEKDGVIRLNALGDALQVNHVFELVLRLKQICNFDPVTQASSKTERLLADLEEVAASGQKAIIFSQWVETLEKIAERLGPFQPLQFHGRIPSTKRDGILAEFKENPRRHVILMSYGAGSVGLNLQFCRYVFLFDRWWNPAIEDQAINRAHRIGAAGSVTVNRLIMQDTIEQRIHEVLEAKRELFRQILSDNEVPANTGLTADDIFGLFDLRTPQGRIARKAG